MKQTAVRRDRNVAVKRDIKLATKAFAAKPSAETLSKAQSAIDTAVKKNILNKSTAARRKSSLSRQAKEAGVKLSGAKKTTTKSTATKKAAAAKKPAATPKTSAAKKPAATKKPAASKTSK